MHKSVRYAFRFLVVVAVLGALPLLFSPSSPTSSPYLSALTDLSAGPALAATHCPDKACPVGGPCFQLVGSFCAKSGGQCFSRGCQ